MEIMAIVFLVVITAYPFVLGAMEGETVPLFAAIGAPVLGMMSFLFFSFAVAFEGRNHNTILRANTEILPLDYVWQNSCM